jgi:two-component system, cell cycle response regulator
MTPKILTVDDSKTIRLIVAKAFKDYECEIFEAANGVEGLSAASKNRPDIIILDLTMPVMDGAEMLGKLKLNPELKSVPVIMLTAEAGRENVLRIAKLRVRDYLIKPFKEELLVERVRRVIEIKPRGEEVSTKRFDDALKILLVDDKPAIVEQIRKSIEDTPWKLQSCATPGQAIEFCNATVPDAVLVSLSLPEGGGFSLFQSLRASPRTKSTPVFGLSVKTAAEEQGKAQQIGFTGIITKPIDHADVKLKITRALHLDTSYRYFEIRDGALMLKIPATLTAPVAVEMAAHLRAKILEAVDSGYDKVIVDMGQVKKADVSVIKLGLNVSQLCAELSLKQRMIGSEVIAMECRNFQETKDWEFEKTFEEALAALNGSPLVPAAI